MQGLLDHHRIFDAAIRRIGNEFHGAAALSVSLDVDTWLVAGSIPLGGGHQSTVLAIGSQYTVETAEVNSWFGGRWNRRAVETSDSKITGVGPSLWGVYSSDVAKGR